MNPIVVIVIAAAALIAGLIVGCLIQRARTGTQAQMPELLLKRLANLLTVKSLVTVILTIVFAVLTCIGRIEQSYMTIYTVIISFYFGIQTTKTEAGGGDE